MGPDELLSHHASRGPPHCHGTRLDGGPAARRRLPLGRRSTRASQSRTPGGTGTPVRTSRRGGPAAPGNGPWRTRCPSNRVIIGRRRFGVPHGAAAALAPCEGEGVAADDRPPNPCQGEQGDQTRCYVTSPSARNAPQVAFGTCRRRICHRHAASTTSPILGVRDDGRRRLGGGRSCTGVCVRCAGPGAARPTVAQATRRGDQRRREAATDLTDQGALCGRSIVARLNRT